MSLTCRDNFVVVKNVMTFKTCPLVRIGPKGQFALAEKIVTIGRFHHLYVTCYREQVRIRFLKPRTCPTIQENKEAVVL